MSSEHLTLKFLWTRNKFQNLPITLKILTWDSNVSEIT